MLGIPCITYELVVITTHLRQVGSLERQAHNWLLAVARTWNVSLQVQRPLRYGANRIWGPTLTDYDTVGYFRPPPISGVAQVLRTYVLIIILTTYAANLLHLRDIEVHIDTPASRDRSLVMVRLTTRRPVGSRFDFSSALGVAVLSCPASLQESRGCIGVFLHFLASDASQASTNFQFCDREQRTGPIEARAAINAVARQKWDHLENPNPSITVRKANTVMTNRVYFASRPIDSGSTTTALTPESRPASEPTNTTSSPPTNHRRLERITLKQNGLDSSTSLFSSGGPGSLCLTLFCTTLSPLPNVNTPWISSLVIYPEVRILPNWQHCEAACGNPQTSGYIDLLAASQTEQHGTGPMIDLHWHMGSPRVLPSPETLLGNQCLPIPGHLLDKPSRGLLGPGPESQSWRPIQPNRPALLTFSIRLNMYIFRASSAYQPTTAPNFICHLQSTGHDSKSQVVVCIHISQLIMLQLFALL
ncbi:hypothetical protein ACRALDRAFT_2017673 [Sodiomyces alcalophilus JCM 7366]|uniref:uncharacterized protein n=1 Tax=Sodiomyces alcalophilus JCM 7366 TaxID=591952 RepID=UPI0039B50D8A